MRAIPDKNTSTSCCDHPSCDNIRFPGWCQRCGTHCTGCWLNGTVRYKDQRKMYPKPDCFDCIMANIDSGDPGCHTLPNGDPGWPGTPPSIDSCPSMSDSEEEINLEKIDPLKCPHFRPRLIDWCGGCRRPIGKPEYSWTLYADGLYDSVPVCSERCKINVELRTNIWRWKEQIERWKIRTGQAEEVMRSYCPVCDLEIFPFSEGSNWWVRESSGTLYCLCPHCDCEVKPDDVYQLVRRKIPYKDIPWIMRSGR